ncbi:MAG: SulP family inorganic anion transporter, partial [Phototrophicaceae bacterium]
PLTKTGPLLIVLVGIVVSAGLNLNESAGISIVGTIPAGLPPLTPPSFDLDWWQTLLPTALAISLVGFMESVSVAKSLAGKRREKIDANQELIALGTANVGAAFTGTYPVAGGIARSAVNFSAGARTGMASIITAGLISITVLLLTPLFYHLPQAILAAIIIVAVTNLLDVHAFGHAWRYSKVDALSMIVTFVAVLAVGVEMGILLGTGAAIALYLWRTSRPHVAVIGRVGDTEHYRNVLRHEVHTYPHIVAVRVDESLYFPNAQYLEDVVLNLVADNPRVEHLVLLCSAVNFIDSSALDVLESLIDTLNEAGVEFHLAEVKGPVMDSLQRVGFAERLGNEHIFLSIHQAIETLAEPKPEPSPAAVHG